MAKIAVKNLYKIFGPNPKKVVPMLEDGATKADVKEKTGHGVGVNNASFEVEEGEIVVIMGLSGSGKSTLVRCINRLIEPTSGSVFIDGVDVTKLSSDELRQLRLQKLGMVFQNFALFPHRTVAENTEYGLEIAGIEHDERRSRALVALEQVGLKGWEDSYPTQLSGGMQQRVGLARALALNADILLMDEAFSALDPLIRSDMQDELLSLQDEMQKTIVFISHDLDEALKLGDRIVLMKDGEIVQIGTAEDILTDPADDYVRRFVEDVDITKILTAESVMKKTETVAWLGTDGPRAALRKMKKNKISSIFVLRKDRSLAGVISAEEAVKLVQDGARTLDGALQEDIVTVQPDTPAADLFQVMHDLPYPLAVVDEKKRLKGVIVRGLLLGAVAERGAA